MILDRKHFSFLVQVIDRGHLNATGGYAEGKYLGNLEILNKGWCGIREPNGSYMHKKGPNKGHIRDKYGFLLLTPVGIIRSLEDVDTGLSPVGVFTNTKERSYVSFSLRSS